MKAIVYGLIVLGVLLVAPAYASDCGGGGYEPFVTADADEDTGSQIDEVFATLE